MEEESLYGKRKKKKNKTPNPFFETWLQEWKQEAVDKGIKSQYVYAKALKSLRKYPLLLTSGKDCKILENFGDKLCKLLDDRLQKHIQEHGALVPPQPENSFTKPPPRQKPKPSKKPAATVVRPVTEQQVVPRGAAHTLSDSESEGDAEAPQPPRKRPRSGIGIGSGEREYIPAYRSGPFALLITLNRDRQSANGRGFMTKSDLCSQAQPLAEKSFTVADPSCRYTAWSSMGTLIKKGLVVKESSPAQYSLTEAGCELAHRLEAIQADDFPARPPPVQRGPAIVPNTVSQDRGTLLYKYVTNDGEEVKHKDKAAVLIDDDLGIGFLIRVNYRQLLSSGKRYRLDTTRPLGEDVFVYLHGDDAVDNVGIQEMPALPSLTDVDVEETPVVTAVKPIKEGKKRTKAPPDILSSTSAVPQLLSFQSLEPSVFARKQLDRISTDSVKTSCLDTIQGIENSQGSSSSASIPNFVLQPGQFEIILCVDNAEFYGSRQGGGKSLLPDLIKNGVTCDLRKLHVGDLLWVAREKTHQTEVGFGQPKGREIVLDYIVERKRMDDLVHSCTDGRLPDQKFRLKHCGLKKPIFMIEDYGSLQHFSIPEDRIRQTITNLKVIDGFQIKRTKNVKESVAYLTVMKRYLHRYYKNKTLYACSRDDLKEQDWTNSIQDCEVKLMEFNEFNAGSVKSRNLSVQDMFCKHLSKVSGMSGERAQAVTQIYPTLTDLMEAYRSCPNSKSAEGLLSTVKVNKSFRNLGINPSRLIHQLYTNPGPLT
ncbi:crossover junction endonuclease MUS81-like [Ostrea edulis]|uniref:crossover junction endonuclease MUS81-like n=1 Tax=Ostrea edulis TaxID=37623 RepID=UPI0024AF2CF6|nr:crossover junction endonuclease MUS81-like [Ostrea edulis]XP_048735320.2 crossover junction endonuclease MUS81-like [Ostrea edulis]